MLHLLFSGTDCAQYTYIGCTQKLNSGITEDIFRNITFMFGKKEQWVSTGNVFSICTSFLSLCIVELLQILGLIQKWTGPTKDSPHQVKEKTTHTFLKCNWIRFLLENKPSCQWRDLSANSKTPEISLRRLSPVGVCFLIHCNGWCVHMHTQSLFFHGYEWGHWSLGTLFSERQGQVV